MSAFCWCKLRDIVLVIGTAAAHSMRSRIYATVRCPSSPSICLSVCPPVPSGHCTPLPRICCCGTGGQEISIDCCTAGGAAVSSSRGAQQQQMLGLPRCQLTLEAEDRLFLMCCFLCVLPSVLWHCWLVVRKSIWPVKKFSDDVLVSGVRCRLFAYGPADATAIPKPQHLLPRLNPDWLLPFWYQLTKVVREKRPLNGCSVM